MVHGGIAETHAGLLVEIEVHVVHATVLEQVGGPSAVLAVHERMAIGAEPHRNALFDENPLDAVLHELVRHVEVFGGVAAGHVAEMLDADLLALGVLGARIVHQAHVIFETGRPHVLLPEFDRRDLAVAVEFTVLVGPLPVEGDRRLTQMDGQDAVARRGGVGDDRLDLGGVAICGVHVRHGGVQQVAQLGVHLTGVLGGFGFREEVLGHGAVLLVHVHGHGPLAAVAHHVGEQVLDQAGVGRLPGGHQGGHVLEEVVDALQLVVVHRVVLGELELLQVHAPLGHETGHVQGAEQPAAAGTILMGGFAVVDGGGEATLHQAGAVVVAGHLVDAGGGHRVHGQTVGAALCEIAAQGIQRFAGQRRQFTHVILLL